MPTAETLQPIVDTQDLLTPDGLINLERFEGALPERYWQLPDEEFEQWANAYARLEVGEKPKLEIVTFSVSDRGSLQGSLIAKELSKIGVPKKIENGLTLTPNTPYLVEQLRDTRPGEREGVFELAVRGHPSMEDYAVVVNQERVRDERTSLSIGQISFFRGKDGRIVGKAQDGRFVIPDRESRQPNAGDEWLGRLKLSRNQRHYFFSPYAKAQTWLRYAVSTDAWDVPAVAFQFFHGIHCEEKPPTQLLNSLGSVEKLQRELPPSHQAILARLWNIWVTGELERESLEQEFVQEVNRAQGKAWRAYTEGHLEYDTTQAQQVVSGKGTLYTMQPVTISDGSIRTFDILTNYSQPSVEAWRRYDEDFDAVIAAEAYQIATSNEHFSGYLKEEEGIDLHLAELEASRPENSRLYIGNLQSVVRNYKGMTSRDSARAEFKERCTVEPQTITNDILTMTLVFEPALYAHPADEKGIDTMFASQTTEEPGLTGDDGRVYEVEYTLATGGVEYRDGYYDLPEHIQDRIADVLSSRISSLRVSAFKDAKGVEKVAWKRASRKKATQQEGER